MSGAAGTVCGAAAPGPERGARHAWYARLGVSLALGVALAVAAHHGAQRYRLALDVQKYYSCLPFDAYLVDPTAHGPLERGILVQFVAPAAATLFSGEFEVVKLVGAVAGDRWRIEADELFVNDVLWGRLPLLSKLGLEPGALDGEGTVPAGAVFVLGTTPNSYDSRYWGALPIANIRGVAHVVL
jgi:conjugal transfer pilin signal peptidase TrbI